MTIEEYVAKAWIDAEAMRLWTAESYEAWRASEPDERDEDE